MPMSIEPQSPFGARVSGFEIDAHTAEEAGELQRAFSKYGVLVFKRLELDVNRQVRLSRLFGETEPHPIESIRHPEEPDIIVLSASGAQGSPPSDPDADKLVGLIPWHTDLFYTETPNRGAVLSAAVIPNEGGRTGFIDGAAAYLRLPAEIKHKVQGLRIVHSYIQSNRGQTMVSRSSGDFPDVEHPLVYIHPENDLPVLNICPLSAKRIVGLPEAEAADLLAYLAEFATDEAFAYIHQWELGDVVMWDNWRVMHRAYGHKKRHARVMHRTTLKGAMKLGQYCLQEEMA